MCNKRVGSSVSIYAESIYKYNRYEKIRKYNHAAFC